jgi:hypothetical protein
VLSPRARRRGVGVLLVIILSFIVVLSIVGVSQRYLTSAVTAQTQRSSLGDLTGDLAESCLEEALHVLRTRANDPGSKLFELFRRDVYADQSGEIDLTPWIQLPQMQRILKDPLLARFYIKDLEARVTYQRQFEDLPYERFGLIRIRARVQFDLSLTDGVTREMEAGVGFKVVLVGPPRPFDQATLLVYVTDAQGSLSYGDVNARKREWVIQLAELIESAGRRAVDPATPEPAKSEFTAFRGQVQPTPDAWQEKLPDLPSDRAAVFAVKPGGAPVAFEDIYLMKKIEEKERTDLVPARRDHERAVAAAAARPGDAQAQRELAATYRQLAQALAAMLKVIADYRDVFRVWGGTEYETLDRFRYKLRADHWAHKPFYTVVESPAAGPIDAQVRKLLGGLKPVNGVLRVDNPTQELDLTGMTIQGKLIIVAGRGGVRVANLNRQERASDLLTVICVGGTLSVEDEVHAALLSSEGRISFKPGSVVHGLVMTDRLPSPADRQFTVVRLEKYYTGITRSTDASGAYPDYYYVGVSPRVVYRRVSRR